MKKISLKVLALYCLGCFFLSCTSFLEENPEDRYVIDNFYGSESDAKASVTAIYEQLYDIYSRNIMLLSALTADDEKNGIGMANQGLQNLEYLKFTSENAFIGDVWRSCYSGISRANTAIIHIPEITMNKKLQKRLVGEAKFLRALYYFNLVRFWGGVPLILKLESVQDALLPRSTKEEVYQQIINDLMDAEKSLPEKYGESDTGRATKGAAKILLGKVYLTLHDYQHAVDKLAEVVNNEGQYGYGLQQNYVDNWRTPTENGNEMVFTIEFMDPPGLGNILMIRCGPKYSIKGGFKVLGLSNANEADIPTMDLYTQFSDDDERKAATFRTNFVSLKDGSIHHCSIPIFVKYWEEGETNAKNCDANMQVLRYSDALLMYAEALNEVGRTGEALPFLNRVRERAFNTSDNDYTELSQDEFRTAVWQERRLEFALEGQRWFDLNRTGRFIERMKVHSAIEAELSESNKVDIANNIKDYMILMPIPQREIDLNPALIQNPGY